ncbi:polysaccharide pyruvyl transferase family protein [Shewanella mangrovisoli]|uniref:polysaccharide pyruvyl transferase family protein n=1 Tax=Shewanella mangrovisoli TaxID=2864211 RepID=UPI0035B729A8
MKKVLVVNRGFCDNLGDQAINHAMCSFVSNKFNVEATFAEYTTLAKSEKLINLNVKPNSFSSKFREAIKKILPLKFIWLCRNLFRVNSAVQSDVDLVIIGGGQLILSNSAFDIAAASWVLFARLHKKPIVFCSVGAGTDFNYLNKALYKYALHNCDGICVRDEKSRDTIKSTFQVDAVVAGDIVFTAENEPHLSSCRSYILLGIPSLSVYNTYNKHVSRGEYYEIWMDFLKNNAVEINDCSLYYTTEDDFVESLLFSQFLADKFSIDIKIVNTSSLTKLEGVLSKTRLAISGRMHGLIIAANHSCDILVFPISKKLISFEDTLNSSNDGLLSLKSDISIKTERFLKKWI